VGWVEREACVGCCDGRGWREDLAVAGLGVCVVEVFPHGNGANWPCAVERVGVVEVVLGCVAWRVALFREMACCAYPCTLRGRVGMRWPCGMA